MRPQVILVTKHRSDRNSAAYLSRTLNDMGILTHRATPTRAPLASLDRLRLVINMGTSIPIQWWDRVPDSVAVYNDPWTVAASSNKLRMFRNFDLGEVQCVDWTVSRSVVRQWLEEGCVVMARTRIAGCAGEGLVLSPPDDLPEARLYTKMFKGYNVREHRVYIVAGEPIDVTQKRRWNRERLAAAGISSDDERARRVRTHRNGWVFARNTAQYVEGARALVEQLARDAAACLRMGYGAVDVLTRLTRDGELRDGVVVETNTAPGLCGDRNTCDRMAAAIAARVQ